MSSQSNLEDNLFFIKARNNNLFTAILTVGQADAGKQVN
jgi:hypothetical protein